jgi:hypothetical protein
LIRENVDLGVGVDAVAGFGVGGLVRENVDPRVGVGAAARGS